jgi:hypothetical protein
VTAIMVPAAGTNAAVTMPLPPPCPPSASQSASQSAQVPRPRAVASGREDEGNAHGCAEGMG